MIVRRTVITRRIKLLFTLSPPTIRPVFPNHVHVHEFHLQVEFWHAQQPMHACGLRGCFLKLRWYRARSKGREFMLIISRNSICLASRARALDADPRASPAARAGRAPAEAPAPAPALRQLQQLRSQLELEPAERKAIDFACAHACSNVKCNFCGSLLYFKWTCMWRTRARRHKSPRLWQRGGGRRRS